MDKKNCLQKEAGANCLRWRNVHPPLQKNNGSLDFLLSTFYSRLSTFTLDSRLLLSTLDFYSRLSTFALDSRPILSTLDPRLLDILNKESYSMRDPLSYTFYWRKSALLQYYYLIRLIWGETTEL
jgi:hypothetical protein